MKIETKLVKATDELGDARHQLGELYSFFEEWQSHQERRSGNLIEGKVADDVQQD